MRRGRYAPSPRRNEDCSSPCAQIPHYGVSCRNRQPMFFFFFSASVLQQHFIGDPPKHWHGGSGTGWYWSKNFRALIEVLERTAGSLTGKSGALSAPSVQRGVSTHRQSGQQTSVAEKLYTTCLACVSTQKKPSRIRALTYRRSCGHATRRTVGEEGVQVA